MLQQQYMVDYTVIVGNFVNRLSTKSYATELSKIINKLKFEKRFMRFCTHWEHLFLW